MIYVPFSYLLPSALNVLVDCSISMPDGILTDVSFNEGDVMMLDVAMKAVTGDHAPITFDLA